MDATHMFFPLFFSLLQKAFILKSGNVHKHKIYYKKEKSKIITSSRLTPTIARVTLVFLRVRFLAIVSTSAFLFNRRHPWVHVSFAGFNRCMYKLFALEEPSIRGCPSLRMNFIPCPGKTRNSENAQRSVFTTMVYYFIVH
jgi:hypothetical protein